jgi:hypothetical protein
MNPKSGEIPKDLDLHAELEALRREVAELRAHRSAGASFRDTSAGTEDAGADEATSADEGLPMADELKAVIQELAESIETGISKRPVAYVLGALLVGILMGRMLSR